MNLRVDAEGNAVNRGAQTEIGGNDAMSPCAPDFMAKRRDADGGFPAGDAPPIPETIAIASQKRHAFSFIGGARAMSMRGLSGEGRGRAGPARRGEDGGGARSAAAGARRHLKLAARRGSRRRAAMRPPAPSPRRELRTRTVLNRGCGPASREVCNAPALARYRDHGNRALTRPVCAVPFRRRRHFGRYQRPSRCAWRRRSAFRQ